MSHPSHRSPVLALVVVFGAGCLSLSVPANAQSSHRPKVNVDEDGSHLTPLSKGLQQTVDKAIKKKKETDSNCTLDHNPKGSERGQAAACGVPAIDVINAPGTECPECGVKDKKDQHGNSIHEIKNKVTLRYDTPSQRGLARWAPQQFNPERQHDAQETQDPTPRHADANGVPDPTNIKEPSSVNVSKESVLQASECRDFAVSKGLPPGLGDVLPDGTCDLSRAVIVFANNLAKNVTAPQGQQKKHTKAFDADDQGNCASDALPLSGDSAIKCGGDRRVQNVTETFQIVCRAPFEYLDGQCVKQNGPGNGPIAHLQEAGGGFRLHSAEYVETDDLAGPGFGPSVGLLQLAQLPAEGTKSVARQAMMGFTFAPPEIKWGYDYSEEMCIDLVFTDFCFTVFSARIGYDFDLGVGLRLPVNLTIDEVPSPQAMAQSQKTLRPKLLPADFSAADFKKFCEDNDMADGFIIASCDRFSFPEFFSSELASRFPDAGIEIDGKEVVAQATVFAGARVEVFEIPVVDFAIDAGADFATLCSINHLIKQKHGDMLSTGISLGTGTSELNTLKDLNINCASFTTPFGPKDQGANPLELPGPRVFPFGASFHLAADCIKARLEGDTMKVNGKDRPLCTGMELRYGPLALGLGLDVALTAGSSLITADWSTAGDARGSGGLEFHAPLQQGIINPTLGLVDFNNYDDGTDTGTVKMDEFTYWLNTLNIALNANIEFGGILSFLPDIASLPIFQLTVDTGRYGIPLFQHNATGPVTVPVFVSNYALKVSGGPAADDPAATGAKTLKIEPGHAGTFHIRVTNDGNVPEDIDNFTKVLPDTDAAFNLPAGWTANAEYEQQVVGNVPARSTASQTVALTITPFRHPLTRPGIFPVPITADSAQARQLGLAARDPNHHARTGAPDTVYVEVIPFYNPAIEVSPVASTGKPGAAAQGYSLSGENLGNITDTEKLNPHAVDFNRAGCTLTTLGSSSGCPFRAVPTVIPAAAWTTTGSLPATFGPLAPTFGDHGSFTIAVPPDWAGMQDTTYELIVTATSSVDPGNPQAHNDATVRQTVVATKQSMTRYIGLELAELAGQIQAANAAGVKTAGALPIITNDVQRAHERALASILSGNLSAASKTLAAEIQSMAAFLKSIASGLPAALTADWTARANAIIRDLTAAQASNIPSQ